MIVILCIEEHGGIAFHNRRQSQDRLLRRFLIGRLSGKTLWMNPYSFSQFNKDDLSSLTLKVREDCLSAAGNGDYCFIEKEDPAACMDRIEGLYLFNWNRTYPSDTFCTVPLDRFRLTETGEFPGSSHERITWEVYTK